MKRLEDDKNQLIVRTIQDALFEAKTSINSFELPEKNGIGLFSLNFIFKMIRKNCKELSYVSLAGNRRQSGIGSHASRGDV